MSDRWHLNLLRPRQADLSLLDHRIKLARSKLKVSRRPATKLLPQLVRCRWRSVSWISTKVKARLCHSRWPPPTQSRRSRPQWPL